MPWNPKNKIPQEGGDERILTPDFEEILVGSPETDVLLYQIGFNNWSLKSKIAAGAWSAKTKIAAGAWGLKTKIEP